jgi:hypothetical protein
MAHKHPRWIRPLRERASFDRHYVGGLPAFRPGGTSTTTTLPSCTVMGPLSRSTLISTNPLQPRHVFARISDHQTLLPGGGFGYVNSFDTWEFIRGQEDDAWAAMVQPPLDRYRSCSTTALSAFENTGRLRTVTRGMFLSSLEASHQYQEPRALRKRTRLSSVKCFAQR